MSEQVTKEQDPLRRAVLVPCETPQELHEWIHCYLGIDLPTEAVDADSTGSPLDAIWTVYNAFRTRKFRLPGAKDYQGLKELMAYASRDSFKTLGAAILEVVVMLHLGLNVAHMAAIERQAKKAQQYVKDFFNKEYLRDFVTVQNETRCEITRYVHKVSGVIIPPDDFKKFQEGEQAEYRREWNYIAIIICTMAGANSEHVPFMVVDEVDVVPNPKAYEEAKAIPSAWQGISPITLYISTRKFAFGLVQKELDQAHETGLHTIHWNILDVTSRCPPTRHLPDQPKIPIYYLDPYGQTRGKAISETDYLALSEDKRDLYRKTEGFAGCLKNCKLFFACKGRLATHQKVYSQPTPGDTFPAPETAPFSPLMKSIDDTIGLFKTASPGFAVAQYLCRKPSEEGLIYPHFEREIHMLTAAQMAEKITGEEYPETFTKAQLVALMKERDLEFGAGMDHGHSHNFSVVTGAKDGHRAFCIDVQSAPGLELDHKIALMRLTVTPFGPKIWGDTADPSSNKSIRRAGFKVQTWSKEKDSVVGGIEIVRSKLYPAVGDPLVYLLKGDPGCELLAERVSKYHWKLDAAGNITNIPEEKNDDECDAFRYWLMNHFPIKGRVTAARDEPRSALLAKASGEPDPGKAPTINNYLSYYIQQHSGAAPDDEVVSIGGAAKGKDGNFFFDM